MDKQISKLKIYIFILGFAFIVQVFFSVLFYRHSNLLHSTSLSSIDSLISEVGDLKTENLLLDHELQSQNQLNEINQQFLQDIDNNLTSKLVSGSSIQDEFTQYKQTLETETIKLNTENSQLNNLLNAKDSELSHLKEKQQIQKQIVELDDKVMVFLLLGQNQKLTDTIVLVFINPEKKATTFVSIPRDLFVDGRKINEYATLFGPDKLESVLKDITGFQIDKYLEIDFTAFTETIDMIGGINIEIDQEIIDTNYPNGDLGYKRVVFKPGIEKMNGERALEYARSRKSTSDFDRSLRQQKVLIAIKNVLAKKSIINNVNFYIALFQKVEKNIDTDLNVFEALQYFDTYQENHIFAGNILSNENFLYSSKSVTGQSMLLPKNGDFKDFQRKLLEII